MPPTLGISLLELFDLPPGVRALVPSGWEGPFALWSVSAHTTVVLGDRIVHQGVLQSWVDAGLPLPDQQWLRLPGLHTGVPFRLSLPRVAVTPPQDVEPDGDGYVLDLFCDRVEIRMPEALRPATRVEAVGVARHLIPDTSREAVVLATGGVVRIRSGADDNVEIIAPPDPFDPDAPAGTVIQATLEPSHVLLSQSGFGFTFDRLTLDLSRVFTPAEIEARGQVAEWTGFALDEATVYLPQGMPVVGDVSFGVRDLIVGVPHSGVQGEVELQLGQAPGNVGDVQFQQQLDDGTTVKVEALADANGVTLTRTVSLSQHTQWPARVRAFLESDESAQWRRPGDPMPTVRQDTGWMEVESADALVFTRWYPQPDGSTRLGTTWTFRFHRGGVVRKLAPRIKAFLPPSSVSFEDVAHLSASGAFLSGIRFEAIDPVGDLPLTDADRAALTWRFDNDAAPAGQGPTYEPPISLGGGTYHLILTDGEGHSRRLILNVLDQGSWLVGTRQGPFQSNSDGEFTDPARVPAVAELLSSSDLASWHAGMSAAAQRPAALASGLVTVPDGTMAHVTVATDPDDDTREPVITREGVAHLRVFYNFDRHEELTGYRCMARVGPNGTDFFGAPDTDLPSTDHVYDQQMTRTHVGAWLKGFPVGTAFVVVGRCCDIGLRARNKALARDRATAMVTLLTAGGVPASLVYTRGEQDAVDRVPLALKARLTGRLEDSWYARDLVQLQDRFASTTGEDRRALARREFRRADLYAMVPEAWVPEAAATACVTETTAPSPDPIPSRFTWVPGADRLPALQTIPPETDIPWRLVVKARWDSPTGTDNPWIPTLAEIRFDFQHDVLAMPGVPNAKPENPNPPIPEHGDAQFWSLIGRYAWDPRTGATLMTLAWDGEGSAAGLGQLDSNPWALVFGLGPAMLGTVSAADAAGSAVRLAAMGGAVALLSSFVRNGKTRLSRVEFSHLRDAAAVGDQAISRLTVDYDVSFDVADLPLGLRSASPVRVRYRGVGLEYVQDESLEWYERIRLVYDQARFEIVDPGSWSINGALGELLGVQEVRMGAGSVWFELDLALGVDLGVLEVSAATVRVTFSGGAPSVELRGLEVRVNVPGVLEGAGRLNIADNGAIDSLIAVQVVPVGVGAKAKLRIGPQADGITPVQLEVDVRFAAGLPLASTGAAIYGFSGRFISHGTRDLPSVAQFPDKPLRELEWYRLGSPYRTKRDQVALGLGVVVGTMPDAGFSFHAVGNLAVELPDLSISLGIDGKFLQKPRSVTEDGASALDDDGAVSAGFQGLIGVDREGVSIGLKGVVVVEHLVELNIPISAWFPYNPFSDSYLRIGTDQGVRFGSNRASPLDPRTGGPVELIILPGLLDVRAWVFVMVEGRGIQGLGNSAGFDLPGFAIGMGAGWGRTLSAGPFSLSFRAEVLAGIGTRPFVVRAAVYLEGSLDLVIFAIGVSAELTLALSASSQYIEGKVCGRIKLFFFTIKGCVGLRIGSEPPTQTEPAPDLLEDLVLMDRFGRIVSEQGAAEPMGWADCIPLLKLRRRPGVALVPGSQFSLSPDANTPTWTGTTDQKHAYRVTAVRLTEVGGAAVTGPLPWSWQAAVDESTHHTPSSPPATHEHRGGELALLTADPFNLFRSLTLGGDGLPGDPAETIRNLCTPTAPPTPVCVYGGVARLIGADLDVVELRPLVRPDGPFPSWFVATSPLGALGLNPDALSAMLASAGFTYGTTAVTTLLNPWEDPVAGLIQTSLRLPHASHSGTVGLTLPWGCTLHPAVREPEVLLQLTVDLPQLLPLHKRLCLDLSQRRAGEQLPNPYSENGITLTHQAGVGLSLEDIDGDGQTEGHFLSKGLIIEVPEGATDIQIVLGAFRLHERDVVELLYYDAKGEIIGRESRPDLRERWEAIYVKPDGVHKIRIGGSSNLYLRSVCCSATVDPRAGLEKLLSALAERFQNNVLSPLEGAGHDGIFTAFPATSERVLLDLPLLRLEVLLRCRAPHVGPWQALRVKALPLVAVDLLSICGVSEDAWAAWQAHEAWRQETLTHLGADHDGGSGSGGLADPPLRWVLKPDTRYEVTVDYQAATWQRSEESASPPSGDAIWALPTVETTSKSRRFRTAPLHPTLRVARDQEIAGTALATLPPIDLTTQATFDPRALAAYLDGLDPDRQERAFFREDPLHAHFNQGHLPQLLARHGYDLRLRVRRTDPAPAALVGLAHPPEVVGVLAWLPQPFVLMTAADQRAQLGAAEAPCIDSLTPPGVTGRWTGALDPNASYDFTVCAVPTARPDAEGVVVARSHFRTSAFLTPDDLIRSLDLGLVSAGDEPALQAPADRLLTQPLPAQVALGDDSLLEAALESVGLDALPLPGVSRLLMLWHQVGPAWRLVGVLVDAVEPVLRPPRLGQTQPRLALASADVVAGGTRLAALQPVRSSASGTRVLLGVQGAGDLGANADRDDLELQLSFSQADAPLLVGATWMLPVPRLVRQEVL